MLAPRESKDRAIGIVLEADKAERLLRGEGVAAFVMEPVVCNLGVVAPSKDAPSPGYRESVKVALASLIGTSIEWYDFFLYGTAAALVFNKLFFPTFDPMIGTLLVTAMGMAIALPVGVGVAV